MDAVAPDCPARPLDWRFLLPHPGDGPLEHLLLFGASELTGSLLELGVARNVTTTPARHARADAAVILAGANVPVEAALAGLKDNGVVYWEVDRRLPRHLGLTPSRAMARLRRAGFTPCAAYWVKPGFPKREMYLPMQSRGAFQWYLNTLYRTTSRSRRVLKAGMRALSFDRRGLAAFAPTYAITACRGAVRQPPLVELACAGLDWRGEVQPVFLSHGASEWNRVAILLFEPEGTMPAAAVKFGRRAAFNCHVESEHECLRELRSLLDDSLRSSVPSSTLYRRNDLAVAVETCVSGANLSSRTGAHRAQVLGDLRLAVSWLARFHRATAVEYVPARDWLRRRLIDDLCSTYDTAFGLTAAERHLFGIVAARLERLGDVRLPIVWQHRDFGPWNIYRDGDRLFVIDWERARRGPALTDALYFATHWGAAVAGVTDADGRRRDFEALFCDTGAGPLGAEISTELAEYARKLAMPAALFPFLLVYVVLDQALDRATRAGMVGDRKTGGRGDNPDVDCVAVLARHALRLFESEACRAA